MNLLHGISILIGWVTTTLDFCNRHKPHPPRCFFHYFLFSGLVKGSAKFNFDLTNSRDITSVSRSYNTILCLRPICLFFLLNIFLLALEIVAWLSQHIDIDGASLVHKGISTKRFLSHSASKLTFSKAISSTSIVDRVMQVCLANFQETTPPPRVKIYPLVDFITSESEIQFASLNSSRTLGNPLKHKP